ncbi:MAG: hypothetical protein KTR26_00840, partial [Flammeovirgaceae bacterium]|nr:hypothetical protein [Flammeovirgaceae bacterium]
QFEDENVSIAASRGKSINCFGLLSRNNDFFSKITTANINTDFIINTLDLLHLTGQKVKLKTLNFTEMKMMFVQN